jgi:hypothetical protein
LPERPIPKADEIIAIDDDLVYPDIVVDDDLDDSDLVLDDNLDDSSLVSVEELAVELPFQTFTSSRTSNRTASLRSCGQQGVFKRLPEPEGNGSFAPSRPIDKRRGDDDARVQAHGWKAVQRDE